MPIDYSHYPPNWLTEIRPRIMQRADNRCEKCGVKHDSIIRRDPHKPWIFRYATEADLQMVSASVDHYRFTYAAALKYFGFTRVILTIAHLDHDKENWEVSDDRLQALCQRCHLKLDIKHHQENRKYGRNHKRDQMKLDFGE